MTTAPRILYLTHDLSDATSHKRIAMLQAGGAKVTVAGFRRTALPIRAIGDCPVINFGRTYNGGFAQRMLSVEKTLIILPKHLPLFQNTDIILARNMEMLAIAARGKTLSGNAPIMVYECLDIHRLLLRNDPIGAILRQLEGYLAQCASALITSSPAFISEYFAKLSKIKLPIRLVENKLFPPAQAAAKRIPSPPWRIGWFGNIRCRKSLELLTQLVRTCEGKVEVVIRGRPSYDQFEDFAASTTGISGLQFLGAYNPADLAALYQDVHFTWAIDQFEKGLNSSWLLPNRLYEGCAYGAIPIAQCHVETGRYLQQLGIGVMMDDAALLAAFFQALTVQQYESLRNAVSAIPHSRWNCSQSECAELVSYLASLKAAAS